MKHGPESASPSEDEGVEDGGSLERAEFRIFISSAKNDRRNGIASLLVAVLSALVALAGSLASTAQGLLESNITILVAIAAAASVILVLVAGLILHRRKRHGHEIRRYSDIQDDQLRRLMRQASSAEIELRKVIRASERKAIVR